MTVVAPFLRVADAEATATWYARLGFEIDWRHRFAPGLPLFVAVRNGEGLIFVFEHRGDADGNRLRLGAPAR